MWFEYGSRRTCCKWDTLVEMEGSLADSLCFGTGQRVLRSFDTVRFASCRENQAWEQRKYWLGLEIAVLPSRAGSRDPLVGKLVSPVPQTLCSVTCLVVGFPRANLQGLTYHACLPQWHYPSTCPESC